MCIAESDQSGQVGRKNAYSKHEAMGGGQLSASKGLETGNYNTKAVKFNGQNKGEVNSAQADGYFVETLQSFNTTVIHRFADYIVEVHPSDFIVLFEAKSV